jgi:hypothetical protein
MGFGRSWVKESHVHKNDLCLLSRLFKTWENSCNIISSEKKLGKEPIRL